MQAFSWGRASAKISVIVAAMLDLQSQTNPLPLGCSFYSPQSSSYFKIQDGGYSVRSPKKCACIAGYVVIPQRS